MKQIKVPLIISIVILLAAAGWYYVKKTEIPKSEAVYTKEVHLSSSSAKKIPPSVNPLVLRLLFGNNLEVERAEQTSTLSGVQMSLVTFRTTDGPGTLRAEYMSYFTNVGWKVRSSAATPEGGYIISAGRASEDITVTISPENGGSSVTISYLPPPIQAPSPKNQ